MAILLIMVNSIIYLFMAVAHGFDFTPEQLVQWGGDFPPLTLEGEWWRVFTSVFVHGGFVHVLMNMYALALVGRMLEPILGRTTFLLSYLSLGVLSSLVSLCFYSNTAIVSCGASGAIFGMFGLYLALELGKLTNPLLRERFLKRSIFFVGYNIFYGFTSPEINNAAHIGGLACGLALGFCLIPYLKGKMRILFTQCGVLGAVLIAMLLIIPSLKVGDVHQFRTRIAQFVEDENAFLEICAKFSGVEPEYYSYDHYKEHVVSRWGELRKIAADLEEYTLPEEYSESRHNILTYISLKDELYALIGKSFEEDTDAYDSEIIRIRDEIDFLNGEVVGEDLPICHNDDPVPDIDPLFIGGDEFPESTRIQETIERLKRKVDDQFSDFYSEFGLFQDAIERLESED